MDSYESFCKAREEMDGWVGGIYVGDAKPIEEQERPKRGIEIEKIELIGLGLFALNFVVRI